MIVYPSVFLLQKSAGSHQFNEICTRGHPYWDSFSKYLRTCSIILLHQSLKSTSIKQPTMVCQSVWYSLKKHFTGYPINQENVIYNSFINCPFSQTQSQSGHLLGIMGHWSIPGLMWMADSFPQFFMSLRLGDHKHWAKIVFSYCACYFIPDSDPI